QIILGKVRPFLRRLAEAHPQVLIIAQAKDGHRGMAFAPDSTYWEGRADKTLEQVERQLRALPPDAILEWHVSDPYGAAAIRKLFEANGIYDVSVIYTPRMP
ncbi:hypothetical protein ACJH6J_30040, partial [Mycobacterium sp. SMC-18]